MKELLKISYNYDFINPNKLTNPNGYYAPACRGADQLIIYDNNNEFLTNKKHTGTNPYGIEAAVNSKGIVVDVNDRVKTPKNGFVLSGHGKAHRFIQENIMLGSVIEVDYQNKIINVITDKYHCLYVDFKNKLSASLKKYNKAINEGYVIDKNKVSSLFNKINEIYSFFKSFNKQKNKDKKKFIKLYNKSCKFFDLLYLHTSKSSRIGSRNIWMRPFEQNLEEILHTLNVCKRCNINGIYVEAFYNGDIPGKSNITDTNKEVINGYYGEVYKNDYLKAFITEAHKLNIEVHAWVECFFIGEKSNQWKKHYKDEWHLINYDGSNVQGNNPEKNENDFIWLDPANPECLDYVLSIYKELITNYEFDGLNLDYVRYPHGNYDIKYSSGYTNYAMNEFKKINNLSGDVRKLVEDEKIMNLWTEYRCSKITLLMKEIRKLVNEVKPSIFISMSVCSDLEYAIKNKMQNWKVWANNGWIDLTLPMAYYEGCSEIANATKELVEFNKDKAFSYTGIMCMMDNLPSMLVVRQINTLLENNADGYAIFQLHDLLNRKQCQLNLRYSVNRFKSVHPHSNINIVLKAFKKEIKERKEYLNVDSNIIITLLNDIDSIITKKASLEENIKQLKVIKEKTNNSILKKEINKLIRYCVVSNDINKRKKLL